MSNIQKPLHYRTSEAGRSIIGHLPSLQRLAPRAKQLRFSTRLHSQRSKFKGKGHWISPNVSAQTKWKNLLAQGHTLKCSIRAAASNGASPDHDLRKVDP